MSQYSDGDTCVETQKHQDVHTIVDNNYWGTPDTEDQVQVQIEREFFDGDGRLWLTRYETLNSLANIYATSPELFDMRKQDNDCRHLVEELYKPLTAEEKENRHGYEPREFKDEIWNNIQEYRNQIKEAKKSWKN